MNTTTKTFNTATAAVWTSGERNATSRSMPGSARPCRCEGHVSVSSVTRTCGQGSSELPRGDGAGTPLGNRLGVQWLEEAGGTSRSTDMDMGTDTGKPTKKSRNEDGSPTATEEDTKESQQRTVEFHAELQRHAARIAQAIAVAPPDCGKVETKVETSWDVTHPFVQHAQI